MRMENRQLCVIPVSPQHIRMMRGGHLDTHTQTVSKILSLIYDNSPVHWAQTEVIDELVAKYHGQFNNQGDEIAPVVGYKEARNAILGIVDDITRYLPYTHGWRFERLIGIENIVMVKPIEMREDEDD